MHRILSQHTLCILLVEDSIADTLLIEKHIRTIYPAGYDLKKAPTLTSALNLLDAHAFDIVLLDRSLPDVIGFEGLLCLQTRAPELPIVFLTANEDDLMAYQAIEHGAQDYLFKNAINTHTIKRAIHYAILRKQSENILIMRANFDMLTGLANRVLFESRLEMALARMHRHGGSLAVLFLDLDRFKQVNDTYGHAIGDALLKEFSCRLKYMIRAYDTAARFGGDEFAILLESLPDIEHGEMVARKIISMISPPFIITDIALEIGISIGIACASGTSVNTCSHLIAEADAAMYQAKMQQGSSYFLASDIKKFYPAAQSKKA